MNETSHILVKFMITLPSKFLIKHSTYLHNRLLDCSDSIKPCGKKDLIIGGSWRATLLV